MSAANVLTLTCPRCAKQSRVGVEHAGQRTQCPHPDCRHALTIPLTLDDDPEPEEAVLIAEGPPVLWPVAPRAAGSHREPRSALRLWVWTAVILAAISVPAALMLLWARPTPAPQVTAIEPPTLLPREKAAGPPHKAPAVRPPVPAAPPAEQPPPPAARPDPGPPAKPPERPKPIDRDAFVGVWEVTWPDLRKNAGWEGALEFRADGTSRFCIDTDMGPLELSGRWRWDGRRLHAELDTGGSTAVEVEWNGPDQFAASADGRPILFRRKPKR